MNTRYIGLQFDYKIYKKIQVYIHIYMQKCNRHTPTASIWLEDVPEDESPILAILALHITIYSIIYPAYARKNAENPTQDDHSCPLSCHYATIYHLPATYVIRLMQARGAASTLSPRRHARLIVIARARPERTGTRSAGRVQQQNVQKIDEDYHYISIQHLQRVQPTMSLPNYDICRHQPEEVMDFLLRIHHRLATSLPHNTWPLAHIRSSKISRSARPPQPANRPVVNRTRKLIRDPEVQSRSDHHSYCHIYTHGRCNGIVARPAPTPDVQATHIRYIDQSSGRWLSAWLGWLPAELAEHHTSCQSCLYSSSSFIWCLYVYKDVSFNSPTIQL